MTDPEVESKETLTPVNGLIIPADSLRELENFWHKYPKLRKGCLQRYGYDPVTSAKSYWRWGLAEPDHVDILAKVKANGNIYGLNNVLAWEKEEIKQGKK